jgi:hypothetical protein
MSDSDRQGSRRVWLSDGFSGAKRCGIDGTTAKGAREREFSFHKSDMNSYYIGDRWIVSYMQSGELVCMENYEGSRNETL